MSKNTNTKKKKTYFAFSSNVKLLHEQEQKKKKTKFAFSNNVKLFHDCFKKRKENW
jgi:hypothetical protein